MTNTVQTEPVSTLHQTNLKRRRTWLVGTGLAVLMLVGLGVGIAVFRGNASTTGTDATQLASAQLTSVQQSCQQWTAGSPSSAGANSPGNAWCTGMTDWMGQHLRNGTMTGSMMWGSSNTLQATCQQWMGTASGAGGVGSAAWCGQMADWMSQHMGSWDNWMTNGNMMGG